MAHDGRQAEPALTPLQRWMQTFIVTPGDDQQALEAAASDSGIVESVDQLVLPSKTLTSRERAGVYRETYVLRLEEALESDYPVLRAYVGPEAFNDLVAAYLERWPSRSYTLNRLGDHLPEFLADQAELPDNAFLADLARFELDVTDAFDAADAKALTVEEVGAVNPEDWEHAGLQPIPALRLRRFTYPVGKFKEAYRDELDTPALTPEPTRLAVYRRNFKVFWLNLDEPGFHLLSALAQGRPLGAAIEDACLQFNLDENRLFALFQEWISEGLFHRVKRDRV